MSIEKLSEQDTAQLLKEASKALDWSAQEITDLREKVASFERMGECRKLASNMDDMLRGGLTVDEYATKLASSGKDLNVVREALSFHALDPKIASDNSRQVEHTVLPHEVDYRNIPDGMAKEAMMSWLGVPAGSLDT